MNILILFSTSLPPADGIASHVLDLANRLRDSGNVVTLMTRGGWRGSDLEEYDGFTVVKVQFLPLYPFHIFLHSPFVKRAIEALDPQPDVIHLHTPLIPSLPKKWPLVTTFHTPMLVDTAMLENVGLKSLLIKIMGKTTSYIVEQQLLRSSDEIISVSQGVADELVQYYDFSNDKINVVTNTVNVDFYAPKKFHFSEKYFLYVGRLAYRKGLFEIIESASSVVKENPYVLFKIVGGGPLKSKLMELVQKKGLKANFEFCGEVRDANKIVEYYCKSYAVIIPSYYESGPLTLLEAMSCGKAVITTPTGLASGLIDSGKNGLMVNPKSVNELTGAISTLLSSPELTKELGDNARETILENMTPELNTIQIESVYAAAIGKFSAAE